MAAGVSTSGIIGSCTLCCLQLGAGLPNYDRPDRAARIITKSCVAAHAGCLATDVQLFYAVHLYRRRVNELAAFVRINPRAKAPRAVAQTSRFRQLERNCPERRRNSPLDVGTGRVGAEVDAVLDELGDGEDELEAAHLLRVDPFVLLSDQLSAREGAELPAQGGQLFEEVEHLAVGPRQIVALSPRNGGSALGVVLRVSTTKRNP